MKLTKLSHAHSSWLSTGVLLLTISFFSFLEHKFIFQILKTFSDYTTTVTTMDVTTVLRRLPPRTIAPPIRRLRKPRTTCWPTREAMVEKPAACNLVMGQVTKILKRGEELPESLKQLIKKEKNDMADSQRFFGGSSFYSFGSPAPSSLPIPSFLTKKKKSFTSLSSKDEEALNLE
ncbi:hypothetical protein FNV43_RR12436 [Rhamnella rubrinervis]|uniref:Uncharacterized protein n=1 Tax=Rhamnella rubrinervis TaxID=2594499 RepID=A0A8K0H7B7_9ROSA|nr:hypothetical protein FNV43_RR12436 [Rhamnella rubrinervis]